MKNLSSVSSIPRGVLLLSALVLTVWQSAWAQTPLFRHPQAGDIYKEYSRTMNGYSQWRVTDPNTGRTDAQANLPNATLGIDVGDLQNAVRAEALVDLWQGHAGTTGKAISFNGNGWISIPDLYTPPTSGECYLAQYNVVVNVPLSHLVQGNNTFRGTNGGQTCYSFDWGQHGMNGIVIRIYYNSSKPHPTGSITAPGAGQAISENPTITASASGPAAIRRVDYIAYYDGLDEDGDGVYSDWHYYYHRTLDETSMQIKGHVGSATSAPYAVTWNTSLVPDQAAGSVKLMARIQDVNDMWYVTNEVTGVSLQRSGASVRMYKATNVPERFGVRLTREDASCSIPIPSTEPLANATSATMLISSFNGNDGSASAGSTFYTRLNSWTTPVYGENHFYKLDYITVPVSQLRTGTNAFSIYCNDASTGTQLHWPGPTLVVRYFGSTPPPPGGATKLSFQTQPSNTIAGGTISPAVTVRIEDASGNLVSDTRSVTVALGSNPGGGTLGGTKTVAAVGGVATFSTLSVNNAGTGYTLTASASGLAGATSSSFNITTTTPPPPSTGNIVGNGGFENGTTDWRHYSNGGAGNDFSVVTDAPIAEGARKARVNLGSTVGSNNQIYRNNLTMEAGTQYRLTFQAYASQATSIRVRVIEQDEDYTTYGFPFQTFALTTGWQTFSVDFTAQNFVGTVTDGMVQFYFVSSTPSTAIYIDGVTTGSGTTPPPPPSATVLLNGSFEEDTYGWRHYANGGPGNAFSAVTSAPVADGAKKASVVLDAAIGTNNQLYQRDLSLTAGRQYRLTFNAYASKATTVQVRVIEQDEDYTTYGFPFQTVSLGTAFQSYSIDFTAANFSGTVSDAMLQFYFVSSSPSTTLYFDRIVVGPVTSTAMNSNRVAEKSGEGIVHADQRQSAVPTETGLMQNYPNPFNPSTQITYALSAPSHVTLEVYNILGERVALLVDGAQPAGHFSARFDAATMPSGLYLYRLTTDAGVLVRKMMLMK